MARSITQIAVVPNTFLGITYSYRMYALCDDGTIWWSTRAGGADPVWDRAEEKDTNIPWQQGPRRA